MNQRSRKSAASVADRHPVAGATRVASPVPRGASQARAALPAVDPPAEVVKVTTVRMPRPLHDKLDLLHGILRVPVNRLINEAVVDYVERRTAEVETDMTRVLEKIREGRRADPHHVEAIAAFVAAEAGHGADDPAEGNVRAIGPAGPTQSRIRSLLAGS